MIKNLISTFIILYNRIESKSEKLNKSLTPDCFKRVY